MKRWRKLGGLFAGAACLMLAPGLRAQVVINEVHYNPPGDDATARLEFIELHNRGATAADITHFRLEFGPEPYVVPSGASIPANGYLVVAEHATSLFLATGHSTPYEWAGLNTGLSNGGDAIVLRDASFQLLDQVDYDDDPPWATGADGNGPSLELINPGLDNALYSSWRASLGENGTPGAQNSTFTSAPTIQSEVPGRLTAVKTLSAVQVTFSRPVTGVVASKLTVAGAPATAVSGSGAGPYAFSGFPAPPPGSVSIAVSAGGINSSGVPFGGDSWTISVGIAVVINEIHYHPDDPDGDAEFIELYNAGTTLANLSGWHMSDGLEFTFASGTTLAPGAFLVVALEPLLLQSVTGYPNALAWGAGRLANEGERLALADASGNEIDVVRYDDRGSWSSIPDGDGSSLELLHPELPNQYGSAWSPSAGANGTPGALNSVFLPQVAPIVAETKHTPILPAAGQSIVVTALVIDENTANPTVTLYHRQDADPTLVYASTPMFDDGAHGDGTAADRVFGATLPGLPDGARMDFTIRASDGVNVGAGPRGHDTLAAGAYPARTYLAKFSNAPPLTDFPHYHLLTTQRTANLQVTEDQTSYDATFVHCRTTGGCESWYNVEERYRGESSLHEHPHSFRVDFPAERPLDSELGFEVTKLQLMAQGRPKQHLGYQFFREAFGGQLLSPLTQFVRLHTSPLSHLGSQDYVYVNVERLDRDFLDSQGGDVTPARFPALCSTSLATCEADSDCPGTESCIARDRGNLYEGHDPGAVLQYQGPYPGVPPYDSADEAYSKETNEEENDWADLVGLCAALDPDTTSDVSFESAVETLVDEEQWARWFAVHMLLVNEEGGIYRDTGDDYLIYFEPPSSPLGLNAKMLVKDLDSVFGGIGTYAQETIWRTTVQTTQRFVRSNAFAGRFVGGVCELLESDFTTANLYPKIDALPFAVADAGMKQQLRNWVAARIPLVNAEIIRQTTLNGVPASPYQSANPTILIGGELNQCGTRRVLVNGQPISGYSVFNHSWWASHTLVPGANSIVVQSVDHEDAVLDEATANVFYDPPTGPQSQLRLMLPRRMIHDKVLTLKAEILDSLGRIDRRGCFSTLGTVTATRLSDGAAVPISVTVFDNHLPVPPDSIRFYHGIGTVSFRLDNGAAEPAGDVKISVSVGGLTAESLVTLVAAPVFRNVSGTLTGANLVWGPDENIRITGNCTVPAGSTLAIHPGTLVMVDTTGSLGNGTRVDVNGNVSAVGTQASPIYFFSTLGAQAMSLTQTTPPGANNPNSWRGFLHHSGNVTSTYKHVLLTGAGNGQVIGHPRPPILGLFSNHSLLVEDSVFADNNGMVISGSGTGNYTVRRSVFSRSGIGAEFNGNGHTLLIEDSWWTGIGWAPDPIDGDTLHVDGPASTQLIKGCVIVDGGDDGIDQSGSTFTVEDTIIHHILDGGISMDDGHVTLRNCLMFNCPGDNRLYGDAYNSTIDVLNLTQLQVAQESILWPVSQHTCSGDFDYTIVGNPAHLGCGVGNQSVNPQFEDPGQCDFDPAPGSPALTAGPTGGRIGWLGFATAQPGTTLSFQDGVDAYAGTQDTYLAQFEPATSHGSFDVWRWDTENPAPNAEIGLIRFDGIFGSGPGQIPADATILGATLRLVIFNPSDGPAGTINEASVGWSEATATYDNFGGDAGVQPDELRTSPSLPAAPAALGVQTIDVTASLQGWLANPSLNFGWVFRPNSADGVQARSSEHAVVAERPKLFVVIASPHEGCFSNSECDDGVPCNTDSCNLATGACEHTPCAMSVTAEGSRYLAVVPPAGLAAVALEVSSAGLGCLPRYVDAAGRLTTVPVFRSSLAWGTLHVADREIVPGTAYAVQARLPSGNSIGTGSATARSWGDTNGVNGVDVFDILCVQDGSQALFASCSLYADEQKPGVPDGLIDINDIQATLDAFSGAAYPDADPCGGP